MRWRRDPCGPPAHVPPFGGADDDPPQKPAHGERLRRDDHCQGPARADDGTADGR